MTAIAAAYVPGRGYKPALVHFLSTPAQDKPVAVEFDGAVCLDPTSHTIEVPDAFWQRVVALAMVQPQLRHVLIGMFRYAGVGHTDASRWSASGYSNEMTNGNGDGAHLWDIREDS